MLNIRQLAHYLLSQYSPADHRQQALQGFDYALEFVEWAHRTGNARLAGYTASQRSRIADELALVAKAGDDAVKTKVLQEALDFVTDILTNTDYDHIGCAIEDNASTLADSLRAVLALDAASTLARADEEGRPLCPNCEAAHMDRVTTYGGRSVVLQCEDAGCDHRLTETETERFDSGQ